jgi:hypothetical protein
MSEPTFRVLEDGVHFEWSHDCRYETGYEFRSVHPLPAGEHGWRIERIEPLTVTPSILCGSCGTHGFITDGKWVSV